MDIWSKLIAKIESWIFYAIVILVWILGCDFPFFWDAISQSTQSNWYFDHHFSSIIVPTDIDTGHPPLWTLYLAFCWSVFGKTLLVSHIAVLPFLLACVFQLYLLVNQLFENHKIRFWAMTLILFQPTFMVQITSLYFELPLIFGFLWLFNQILRSKNQFSILLLKTIIVSILLLTSIRAWFLVAAIFSTEIGLYFVQKKKFNIIPYLISGFILVLYLWFHFNATGWFFSAPAFSSHRKVGEVSFMARNFLIFGWQIIDNGRLVLMLIFGYVFLKNILNRKYTHIKLIYTLSFISLVFMMLLCTIPFSNPFGPRYFNLIYTGIILCVLYQFQDSKLVHIINVAILLCFLSGHYWKYPYRFNASWDATFAHIAYFDLKTETDQKIKDLGIYQNLISAQFPFQSSNKNANLMADSTHIADYGDIGFENSAYFLVSNLGGEFNEEEIQKISKYQKLFEIQKGNIWVQVFKK